MEFLIIVCSATLQDVVDELFEEHQITSYTHIPEATGAGKGGGIRLNDEVWPGENSLYIIALEKSKAEILKTWAREYRKEIPREGLKLFSLPLNEII